MELFSGIPDPSLLIFYPSLPVFAYLCLLFQKWQRWPVKCTRVFASAPRDARGSIELFSGIPGPSLLHFYPSFHFFSYRQRKFTELFYATLYIVVLWWKFWNSPVYIVKFVKTFGAALYKEEMCRKVRCSYWELYKPEGNVHINLRRQCDEQEFDDLILILFIYSNFDDLILILVIFLILMILFLLCSFILILIT